MSDQESEVGKCDNGRSSERSASSTKKAVHVKWAGKTIALGTYLNKEADEICARAKDLTRSWRSTMRPKPSRKWVMLELEKLEIRKVSSRLGRKCRKEESSDDSDDNEDYEEEKPAHVSSAGLDEQVEVTEISGRTLSFPISDSAGGRGVASYPEYATQRDHQGCNTVDTDNDKMNDDIKRLINGLGLLPPDPDTTNTSSGGTALQRMARPVNSSFHYEMLKLHYMNLLTEIQETKLLMNLFEQQELQKHIDTQLSGAPVINSCNISLPEQLKTARQNLQTDDTIDRSAMNMAALGPAGAESIEMQNMLRQQQSIAMGIHPTSFPAQRQHHNPKKGDDIYEETNIRRHPHLEKLRKDIADLQRQADELAAVEIINPKRKSPGSHYNNGNN